MTDWVDRLRIPFSILVVVTIWQLVYSLGIVSEKYFPSIFTVAEAFWRMTMSGELLSANIKTFSRALIGLAGAGLLGIVLAILSDLYPAFGRGFRYISDIVQPVPPAAFVPMAVFSLGLGMKLYAFVIILVTIWPPYLNGLAALQSVSGVQLNTGRMLGCSKRELLWQIKLPAAMPEIFAGLRYAATIALIAVIVSEMLAGRDGIGFMIFKKAFALRTTDVFALMFVVGLNGMVNLLRRSVVGWHIGMMERAE